MLSACSCHRSRALTLHTLRIMLSWAGKGQIYDATGAAFGLWWISLNRLDSNLDYQDDNVRPPRLAR